MYPASLWWPARDGDPDFLRLASRHYTHRKHRRQPLAIGPGQKLVLVTADGLATFAWRRFIDDSQREQGVCCVLFRNEGPHRSSSLIAEAVEVAWSRWPGTRLYTHVNPARIRSVNPGFCFKAAGWSTCGHTQRRQLVTLELRPPEPCDA